MKKILGIILSLMIMAQAQASISVAPTRIEINANKTKQNYITTSVDVRGSDTETVRFKAYSGYFIINDRGEFQEVSGSSPDSANISKRIRFVPSEFNVLPGKTQKLRINITNLNTLPDGESRAVLFVEDVNQKEYGVNTGMNGIGAQLIVKTRVAIPIYVDKGNFTKKAEVESFAITKEKSGLYTNLKVKSTGSTKVRYTAKVQIVQGKKLLDEYNIYGAAIASGKSYTSKYKMQTDKIKGAGEYTVRAIITYEDEKGKKQNVKTETQLNIQGEM